MFDAADEIYRSYIMRNIAPGFPACMFIPIIASRRVASPYVTYPPPESCHNLDQSPLQERACRLEEQSFLPNWQANVRDFLAWLFLYPDRVQHLLFFPRMRERKRGPIGIRGREGRRAGSLRPVARIRRFIQSRIASAEIGTRSNLISRARGSSISSWWLDLVSGRSLSFSPGSECEFSRPLSVGKQNYEVGEYFSSARDNALSMILSALAIALNYCAH